MNLQIEITGCNKKPLILGTRLTISNLTTGDNGVYHCNLWYSGNKTRNGLLFQENFTLSIGKITYVPYVELTS